MSPKMCDVNALEIDSLTTTLTAILQDLTQMAIVIFAYFSWGYMSSVLVRFFTWRCHSAGQRKHLVQAIKPACDSQSEEPATPARSKAFNRASQQWLELLDQYAVFQAPAGSWIAATSDDQAAPSMEIVQETIFDTKSVRSNGIDVSEHADAEEFAFGKSALDAESVESIGMYTLEHEHAEVEDVTFGDVHAKKPSYRARNFGFELLEQYDVFGASVGSWTNSTVGKILTAVA